jgi:hypothetical protein
MRAVRYLWAGPMTLLGLAIALCMLRRGHIALVDGIVEAHGPMLGRALRRMIPLAGGADAMTLGHVVIARDAQALEATRAHERAHVRQYELWGALFVPAYFMASLCAVVQGGHPYYDNRFERQAFNTEA